MRVLFLDFDGVLHPASATFGLSPQVPLSQIRKVRPATFVHAGTLAEMLLPHDDVRLLVHSSWRNQLEDDELRAIVPELQPWFAGSVGARYRGRDEAIRAWLAMHGTCDFRVLDDEEALFSGSWPQLIVCNPVSGLGDPDVQRALREWLTR